MHPTTNPFAPGAGTPPPELAGRKAIIDAATIALQRVVAGKPDRSQLMLGLRGVGKTVLLNRISEIAQASGYWSIELETPEDQPLAQLLVPRLRTVLIQASRIEKTQQLAKRSLQILRAFASAFKVSIGEIELAVVPETGTADSGDLEADLPDLLATVANAARVDRKGIALFIDEVQYLSERDLSALIVAVHKLNQKSLPFIVFGAGLPQLAALAGEAKSYAERLFRYPDIGPLAPVDAQAAILEPLKRANVTIAAKALDLIVERTQGYPYFLQEWGYHTWDQADASPITLDDVEAATAVTLQQLDHGFFRVRLDRLTPRERDYMRAMAHLGAGPHRSGDIAKVMHMTVTSAGPLRNGLQKKGMIFSPQYGDTAFTVPMFDAFMKRSLPDWVPPAKPRRKR